VRRSLVAGVLAGPQPGSRWSAQRTNDLDAGEDRRTLKGARERRVRAQGIGVISA